MLSFDSRIVLPGGAGLVGQNLVVRLKEKGYRNLVILDKHQENMEIMKRLHPDLLIEFADLAEEGAWTKYFEGVSCCVMLQAQIGAKEVDPFLRNNILSTEHVLNAIKKYEVPFTVHISSSVVESVADDDYTRTKRKQEGMVLDSGIACVVLRPTLMFGWFDRKHLGWLSRFMKQVPVFPVPGDGRYMRQPLYVGDFCRIIVSCIEHGGPKGVYNISGFEKIDYVDIIRRIRSTIGSKTVIIKIPVGIFSFLLRIWALFDSDPPFTADQLKSLVAKDEFEIIDWQTIFGVESTPFAKAVEETFTHPIFSGVTLKF